MVVRVGGQVRGIALGDGYVFTWLGVPAEYFYVAVYQFYRVNGVALARKGMGITAGPGVLPFIL